VNLPVEALHSTHCKT